MEEKKINSLIQPTLGISKTDWVLSLLLRPKSSDPEHTFLFVEGLDNVQIEGESELQEARIFRKYDFMIADPKSTDENLIPFFKRCPGAIQIREDSGCVLVNWPKHEHKDYHQQRIFSGPTRGLSWPISKQMAEQLHTQIRSKQNDRSHYQACGQFASAPKLSCQSGHNCYTWALQQLITLDPAFKKELPNSFRDLFGTLPSRHLNGRDPEQTSSEACFIL